MGIMQQIVVERPQIDNAVVIIIIRHFRIAKTGKISLTLPFCPFDLICPIKGGIDYMDLAARFETGQAEMQYLLQGREIFDGCCKNDNIKPAVPQDAGTNIPVDKSQIGIVAKDTRRLLQFRKVYIGPRHLCTGHFCQMMGQPAVAATDLQNFQCFPAAGQVAGPTVLQSAFCSAIPGNADARPAYRVI